MPRINPNTTPDTQAQELLGGVKKLLGSAPNIFTTLAHSAAALKFYVDGIGSTGHNTLPAKLREQIALAVAGVNDCDYCASAHTTFGKMHKIPEDELKQNLLGKSSDAKTEAALVFSRQVVEARGKVSDADVKTVRDAGYDDAAIIDIVTLVGLNTFTNYINLVTGAQVDFPFVAANASSKAA